MKAKLTPEEKAAKRAAFWSETKTDLKWVTVLLFVLVLTGPLLLHYSGLDRFVNADAELTGPYGDWEATPEGEEDLANVTGEIFGTATAPAGTPAAAIPDNLVVPFEVLSILLLAALIAGVVIALRDVDTKGGR